MSAYSEHAAKCNTCQGFDAPGSRSYSVPARCAEGAKFHANLGKVSKKVTRPPSMPTPKLAKDPEVFPPNSDPMNSVSPTIKVNDVTDDNT